MDLIDPESEWGGRIRSGLRDTQRQMLFDFDMVLYFNKYNQDDFKAIKA